MVKPTGETAASLEELTGIAHGFFGRFGVDGQDFNMSENFGTPEDVGRNRAAALAAIGLDGLPLAGVKQVHSAEVVTLTDPASAAARPEADGIVTALPGIVLGILTADCAPLLFADPAAGIIGACHAGWRGALDGILANTIKAMEALGARRNHIRAALGPTISGTNYEVGPAFAAEAIARNPDAQPHIFTPQGASREHFDLPGFIAADIKRLGLQSFSIAGSCTLAHSERYFSHRHATQNGGKQGRQIAIIARRG